jgi:hypothetical protein
LDKFFDALRQRFKTPRAVMDALGLDQSLLEEAKMAYPQHYRADTEDRHRTIRDACRRAADADLDDPDAIEEPIEALAESHPEILGAATREITEDGRGAHRWARDRRERRMSRDALHHRPPRRAGDRPTLVRDKENWGPYANEEPARPIENFPERRGQSHRQETLNRRRAHDAYAYDADRATSPADTFIRMFGREAFAIQTQR